MLNTPWPAQEAKMPGIVEFFFVLFVALRDERLVILPTKLTLNSQKNHV